MPKITYTPKHRDDPYTVEWSGKTFVAGKPVDCDARTKEGKEFVERARGNPWFEVEGEKREAAPKGAPASPEEYRGYAIEWIGQAKTLDALDRRWREEQTLRDAVGWGTDDDGLIAPILSPRRDVLKRMALG